MGRSVQELVRGLKNLGVGCSFVRTHGAPVTYVISEARPHGGLNGNVLLKGAQLPLDGGLRRDNALQLLQ